MGKKWEKCITFQLFLGQNNEFRAPTSRLLIFSFCLLRIYEAEISAAMAAGAGSGRGRTGPDGWRVQHVGFWNSNRWEIGVKAQSTYCTYVEYRAVSGVFQNIDPPPPLPLASVSYPRTKGGYTLAGRVRGWGVNILEDARHGVGLLQYNPSTG
jgi:hypothetical protein